MGRSVDDSVDIAHCINNVTIRWDSKCHCGNISFSGSTRDLHCCPGPQPCRLDPGTGDVVCPGAEATPLERPCSRGGELTCYNDYGLSEVLGRGARY